MPIKRGFSFNDLRTIIESSISTRVVAIMDCCHSGSANVSKGNDASSLILSINEDSKILEQGEGKCILAASQSYQSAYLFDEQGHSIFTYYMLEALKGNEEAVDNNGNVTPYSLDLLRN
jgi:uncharacterized caspase-like protein